MPPDAISRCRSRLESKADLRLYTTEIAMADLDDVRSALGYEQVNLYGTSYGTRAAQIYMRDFPARVRTVTLKGVVPQSMTMPATHAPDAERAWNDLVKRCSADAECRAAVPTLDADFRSVITRLDRSPVTIDTTWNGRPAQLTLTRGLFGESFRNVLYNPALAARAPSIVKALTRSDYSPVAQVALQTRTLAGSDDFSAGFFLSVSCTEDVPFVDMKTAADAARSTFGGDFRLEQQRRACALWPRGTTSPTRGQPVRSDVPVLLFSGEHDPVTPPAGAAEVAKHLSRGRHVVVANNGHAFGSLAECGQRLIAEFIAEKSAATLDISCASQIPPVPFQIER
jgi:pimeloyl-ACP methyl ester carboxylesterase